MSESGSENPIVALFDLDGTLADYSSELRRRLALMRSPNEPESSTQEFGWGQTTDYIHERKKAIQRTPGFWINLPPLEAGFAILSMAHELGFQIEILTKGPMHASIAWMEKLDWCAST